MADNTVSGESEKDLYLMQIRYLEEQLEKCQHKCGELEEQNKVFASQKSALEKDNKDKTDHLKNSLAAKEKKVDELVEQLDIQQQTARQDREALNVQHSQQKQKLQEQIAELNSRNIEHAAKIEKHEEQMMQLMQQQRDVESLEKKLAIQREEHKAAIHNLKMEAAMEKEKLLAALRTTEDARVGKKVSDVLHKEMAQHSRWCEQVQFLSSDIMLLQDEKDALRAGERDLCVQRDNLKKEQEKGKLESITYKKEVKLLSDYCQVLKVELKDCSLTQKRTMALIESLRQQLDPLFEEYCEKAKEEVQLEAELQKEKSRLRQLEGVMQEGAMILRHILRDSHKEHETQWKVQRLLEILESTAPQGTVLIRSKKNSGGQKPQTSSLKSARKLCSQKMSSSAGAQATVSLPVISKK